MNDILRHLEQQAADRKGVEWLINVVAVAFLLGVAVGYII